MSSLILFLIAKKNIYIYIESKINLIVGANDNLLNFNHIGGLQNTIGILY